MKYLAAYCLAALSGNENADVKKILSSIGIEAEKTKMDALFNAMKGKKLHEVISQGMTKVGALSLGGGGGAAAPAGGSSAPSKKEEAKKKKEEKKPPKEEPKEEEEEEVFANDLFGGDF